MGQLFRAFFDFADRFYFRNINTVELRGIKIPMDGSIISSEVSKYILDGSYEAREASGIQEIITEGERVLELGSGIGFLSSLILKNPKVEAFLGVEAHPRLPRFIKRLFRLNGVDGKILNVAVTSDQSPKTIDYYVRKDFWVSSILPVWSVPSAQDSSHEELVKVKCLSLDHLIRDFRPSLIVCDIEGSELDLFRAADLSSVSKVYLELHPEVIGFEGIKKLHKIFARQGLQPRKSKTPGDGVVLFARS